ncbi:MAG: hypothetical protein IPL73_16115 [Candidatus Obscuribacter sp.]|nr:hypothetical protein [Candidatus Obscuribacter sp.]
MLLLKAREPARHLETTHLTGFWVSPSEATLLTADAIIMESGLSFLGLVSGRARRWGSMLRDAQPGLLAGNFWAALLPGLLISTAVIAIHLLCEGYMDTVSHGIRTRAR